MLFKITAKCYFLLANLFLKLISVVERIIMIFTMTFRNRDSTYRLASDTAIIFLICMLYLFCVYREVLFIFSVFPHLLGIENLIALGNVGFFASCTFVSFVSFQYKMDKLKRLINLCEKLRQNRGVKYKYIHMCSILIGFLHLFAISVINFFVMGFVEPFFKSVTLYFGTFGREFWLLSPLCEFCLWLNAFKTTFQKLTTLQQQRMIKRAGSFLGSDRCMYSVYNREGTRRYIRDVRLLMNIKCLIVEVYGMPVILNILRCCCLIIFNINIWGSGRSKVFVVQRFTTSFLKVGFLFWSAESTTNSVRISNCSLM